VVRLIRSKSVGVFFISQSPLDIPDKVLGQLGNRVQHALRAFTPRDQKSVKAAAETFRANPKIKVADAITQLGVGEALVSTLDVKGSPTPVERALICPPASRIGPATAAERAQIIGNSALRGQYEKTVDRESAYELLKSKATKELEAKAESDSGGGGLLGGLLGTGSGKGRSRQSAGEAMVTSAARAIGSQVGRQIIRGVLGSLLGGRR
jgi:DNA helicase HerA-like ATPase